MVAIQVMLWNHDAERHVALHDALHVAQQRLSGGIDVAFRL